MGASRVMTALVDSLEAFIDAKVKAMDERADEVDGLVLAQARDYLTQDLDRIFENLPGEIDREEEQ